MLSSNKERKMGLQPLFLSNFFKINPWVFAVFHKYRGTIYIQENRFFQHVKHNKHRFHYKNLLICQEATNIFKKNEQHDINKLFNGI